MKVKKVINHPKFDYNNIDFDYSIVEIKKSLTFSKNVQPIKLHDEADSLQEGRNCSVSGWGTTQVIHFLYYNNFFKIFQLFFFIKGLTDASAVLRATTVPIVSHENCNAAYAGYGGITEQMLCAGYENGGSDSCQGDSGGPLASDGFLVGVVSWGKGCAEPGYPGVYAKVSAVRKWIFKIVGV